MSIYKKTLAVGFGFCILNGILLASSSTPLLKGGRVSAQAGAVVDLPIHFDPGSASIASLQFNLTLPDHVSTVSVTPEKTLTMAGADKSITQRLKGRTLTCMVFGLNQNKIGSGDLMAVRVQVDKGTSSGKLSLPISNVVYADPTGHVIPPGQNSPGAITVTAPTPKT